MLLYIRCSFAKPFFPRKNFLYCKERTFDFYIKTMYFFVDFFKIVYRIYIVFVYRKKQNQKNVFFTRIWHDIAQMSKKRVFHKKRKFSLKNAVDNVYNFVYN